MVGFGACQGWWAADAPGVPCQLLTSVHENAQKKSLNPLYLCSIDRVLGCYPSVRSSEITSPAYPLPTLLIVDAFHRQTVCLVLMAGKILLLSQLPLPKFAEEPTWWGTK